MANPSSRIRLAAGTARRGDHLVQQVNVFQLDPQGGQQLLEAVAGGVERHVAQRGIQGNVQGTRDAVVECLVDAKPALDGEADADAVRVDHARRLEASDGMTSKGRSSVAARLTRKGASRPCATA